MAQGLGYQLGRAFARLNMPGRVATALGLVALLGYCMGGPFIAREHEAPRVASVTSKQPDPPDPQKLAREREFQTVVAGARWLKENMHNPKSFELVSAFVTDGGKAICYEYRGTNAFNAIVKNHRVISDTVNSGKATDWNKHCAGKAGTDYSYARHAI